jgi:hypothetical protein
MVGLDRARCPQVRREAVVRDPSRIPMLLAALERRWGDQPDQRLGQLLMNVSRGHDLFALEDDRFLALLGPKTAEERRYVEQQPVARQGAWREGTTLPPSAPGRHKSDGPGPT